MTFTSFLQIGCLWEPGRPLLVGGEALPGLEMWPQANKKEREEQVESPDWEGLGGCSWSCPSVQCCSEQGTQIKSDRLCQLLEELESFCSMPAFEGNGGLLSEWSWFPLRECWLPAVVCTLGRRCGG